MVRFKDWLKGLPDRKPHLDFLVALLTIPVLITVVAANLISLRNKDKEDVKNEVRQAVQTPSTVISQEKEKTEPSPTTASCKKEVGPVSIDSPKEDETVRANPICITINYKDQNYCSVVWSYRINGGQWSDYSSNNVCLYNPQPGDVNFELRVQSTVSQDQETLRRNFRYTGTGTVPTTEPPTPTIGM